METQNSINPSAERKETLAGLPWGRRSEGTRERSRHAASGRLMGWLDDYENTGERVNNSLMS